MQTEHMTIEAIRDFDHELPQEPGRERQRSHGVDALMGVIAATRPRGTRG